MEKKLRENTFDLNDYLAQLQQMRKMGPLDQLLGMIPGMGNMQQQLKDAKIDEKEFDRVEAILRSMTKDERSDPTDPEREQAEANSRRQRDQRAGSQPADEAVRRDEEDDPRDDRRGGIGEAAQENAELPVYEIAYSDVESVSVERRNG